MLGLLEKRALLLYVCTTALQIYIISSNHLNLLPVRLNCYPGKQPNGSEHLIDVYNNVSKSETNEMEPNTYFLLFTKYNPDDPEKIHLCEGKLPSNSHFRLKKKLIVILTSYFGVCEIALYREEVMQFLKKGDFNILIVDYSWIPRWDYGSAIKKLKVVANQTVKVLENIQNCTSIKKDDICLIGHQLGAQLAGLIGAKFPVHRIIGLDPPRPGFTKGAKPEDKLDPTDADLVEVWYGNSGSCLPQTAIDYDAGHVNFYINGGSKQESCKRYAFESLLKGDYLYAAATGLFPTICSHYQCNQYFKVSINPENCQFLGVECHSQEDYASGKCEKCGKHGEKCAIMGFDFDKYFTKNSTSPKKYFVTTSTKCPYCDNSHIKLQGFRKIYKSSLKKGHDGSFLKHSSGNLLKISESIQIG